MKGTTKRFSLVEVSLYIYVYKYRRNNFYKILNFGEFQIFSFIY